MEDNKTDQSIQFIEYSLSPWQPYTENSESTIFNDIEIDQKYFDEQYKFIIVYVW